MQDGTRVLPQKAEHHKVGWPARCWRTLFLHYAFDKWMDREHADIPFERYADDAVCHCKSESPGGDVEVRADQTFERGWAGTPS